MSNSYLYSREGHNKHLTSYLQSEGIDPYYFFHELKNKNPKKTISRILADFAKLISTPLDWSAKKSTELLLPLLISLKEKRRVNLDEISLELTGQIFPEEILSKLDKLSPGLALRWETELKVLTDSLIYAPFRVIQASFLEGLFTGIVASSGNSFAAIGFIRVFINAMTESVLVLSDQDFNRLWGMIQALATDIRNALEGSRESVNAETISACTCPN